MNLLPTNISTSSASANALVAYFSHSGNTRTIARQIQAAIGADVFEIKPVAPYPTEYNACVEQARQEQAADYCPLLESIGPDLKYYRLIFVGSPNWWNTIAPPVKTFLAARDLTGNIVVPFITHEGSHAGKSRADVKQLCPGATVVEARAFWGGQVKQVGEDIRQWLRGLKLLKKGW